MKRKSYILLLMVILSLTIILAGCKKSIEEKITEAITEKVIEDATGADIDLDSDSGTITTESGTTQIGSNIKWPSGKVGNLTELKANLTLVSEDKENKAILIYFDSLSLEDAEKYIDNIKAAGYEAEYETSSNMGYTFQGNNGVDSEVVFFYNNDGSGALTYTIKEIVKEPEEVVEEAEEEIDMTDAVPWPSDFFGDVPEPEGKITQVSSNGSHSKYVYLEYVTKEVAFDYLDTLKDLGFTVDASESLGEGYIDYYSYNENGDYISFSWNTDHISINFDKVE